MTLRALCASWRCRSPCRCTHTKGSTSWLCLLFSAAWDHAVATYTAACKQVLAEREDMDDDDAEAATPGGAAAGAGATAGAGTSDAAASPSFGAQCAVLFHLYWRIGRETGSMQRAMQDAGLSWGYFLDHVPEPHNNAHPGNFVVLPPVRACVCVWCVMGCVGVRTGLTGCALLGVQSADGMGPLLAPVDLDLAFTRGTYFDNSSSPPGARADSEFISALKHEHDALLDNLSGSTASTGLADMAVRHVVELLCAAAVSCGSRFNVCRGARDSAAARPSSAGHCATRWPLRLKTVRVCVWRVTRAHGV